MGRPKLEVIKAKNEGIIMYNHKCRENDNNIKFLHVDGDIEDAEFQIGNPSDDRGAYVIGKGDLLSFLETIGIARRLRFGKTEPCMACGTPLNIPGEYFDSITVIREEIENRLKSIVEVPPTEALKLALQKDEGWAWSWHCNIASGIMEEGVSHFLSNKMAGRLMKSLFDVDTDKTFKSFMKEKTDEQTIDCESS